MIPAAIALAAIPFISSPKIAHDPLKGITIERVYTVEEPKQITELFVAYPQPITPINLEGCIRDPRFAFNVAGNVLEPVYLPQTVETLCDYDFKSVSKIVEKTHAHYFSLYPDNFRLAIDERAIEQTTRGVINLLYPNALEFFQAPNQRPLTVSFYSFPNPNVMASAFTEKTEIVFHRKIAYLPLIYEFAAHEISHIHGAGGGAEESLAEIYGWNNLAVEATKGNVIADIALSYTITNAGVEASRFFAVAEGKEANFNEFRKSIVEQKYQMPFTLNKDTQVYRYEIMPFILTLGYIQSGTNPPGGNINALKAYMNKFLN